MPLAELAIVLLGSLVGLLVFSRLRIPEIVGFLLTGIIVGPSILNLAGNSETILALSEIGVLLLLFTVGLEFSFQKLSGMRRLVFGGGGLYVLSNIAIAAAAFSILGWTVREAIFLGCLVALSSTALVLKVLEKSRMMEGPIGAVSVAILLFQDLAIVPIVLLMPLLATGGEVSLSEQLLKLGWQVVLIVPTVVGARRYILPALLKLVGAARSQELFVIAIFAICICFAWGADALGISMALGAFVAGLLIAESQFGYQAYTSVHSFEQLFSGIFFVSIGMLFDLQHVIGNLPVVLSFVFVIWLLNLVGGTVAVRLLGYPPRFAFTVALVLSQIGEFSFVLIGLGVAQEIVTAETAKNFIAAGIITMVVSPYFINRSRAISAAMLKTLESGSGGARAASSASAELEDHIVIIGFGLTGRCIAQAATAANIAYVIVEMNPQSVAEERQKGERIFLGDATSKYVLEKVGVKRARMVCVAITDAFATRKIVDSVSKYAPGVEVVARCKQLPEVSRLTELGAKEVVSEELEASVQMVSKILIRFSLPDEQVALQVASVRRLQV